MAGWIKWAKDLETKPRFDRMVRDLMQARNIVARNAPVTLRNRYVTEVRGALLGLWIYADTHLQDDNVLDMTSEELNDLLGVPEFTSVCPREWLVILEDGRVQLPGFIEKNGIEAMREPKSNAQRQAEYRARKRNESNGSVVTSNGRNVDQTRPDQIREEEAAMPPLPPTKTDSVTEPKPASKAKAKPAARGRGKAASPLVPLPEDFALTDQMREQALKRHPDCDVAAWFVQFCAHHRAHAKVMANWLQAWITWIGNGVKFGYPRLERAAGGAGGLPCLN